jgi:predicted transporter
MGPLATIVDWSALLDTVWASFAAGVGITFAFSASIYGAVRFAELRRDDRPVAAGLAAGLMLFGLLFSLAAIALGVVEMTRK